MQRDEVEGQATALVIARLGRVAERMAVEGAVDGEPLFDAPREVVHRDQHVVHTFEGADRLFGDGEGIHGAGVMVEGIHRAERPCCPDQGRRQ